MNGPSPQPRAERASARRLRIRTVALFALAVALPAAGSPWSVAGASPLPEDRIEAAIPAPVARTGFPFTTGGHAFRTPPIMADLDRDGRSEILAIDVRGFMHAIRGDGSRFAQFNQAIGGPPAGAPAVGDIDRDGFIEIVTVATNGKIRVFSDNGSQKSDLADLAGTPVGGPLLVPMDGSGELGVVVATSDGLLHAYDPGGVAYPGWPVQGSAIAASPAFAYIGPDNFPRIGYLGANPNRVQVFFTYGARDEEASPADTVAFTRAAPVAGARALFGLPDADHVYIYGRHGELQRLNPDPFTGGTTVTTLAGLPDDSVFVRPALFDADGDLVPEIAVLALRGTTVNLYLVNGASGLPYAGFPRPYAAGDSVGGIACADIGDDTKPEIVFTQGGDKVSCVRTNATEAWTLDGLPSVVGPALGDLDGDEGVDMVIATTTGELRAYSLGAAGVGLRGIEWAHAGGSTFQDGRHLIRDRALIHPFWPPPITPKAAFATRPVIAEFDGDLLPEALWSDYVTGKTFGFGPEAAEVPGMPFLPARGAVNDAPAIGDITGDLVAETVVSTAGGWIAWKNRNGASGEFLVANNRLLSPPTLADVNGDGTLDVLVGVDNGNLVAMEAIGTPALIPGFPVSTGAAISLPPAVGDISGDGQTDIVVVAGTRTLTAYARTGGAALAGWPRQYASGSTLTQPILVPVAGQGGLGVAFGRATGVDSVVAHLVGANGAPLAGWPRRLINSFNLVYGPVAGDFSLDGVPDLVFSTGGDSIIVFNTAGNRHFARHYPTPGDVEVCGMVDLDLDLRPEIIAVSDAATLLGIRFNGLNVRAFTRFLVTVEPGAPPAFGDLGNDGRLDMAVSDLGLPLLYTWGEGSWNAAASPWPMKGHDRMRTNAFSGPTVIGVDDPGAAGPPARGTGLVRAAPNPARGAVAFTHSRPLAGRYDAAVFDVRGRRVRVLASGQAPAAGQAMAWTWDGRDDDGASVAAGIYFYVVRDGAGLMREKVVRLP